MTQHKITIADKLQNITGIAYLPWRQSIINPQSSEIT